MTEIKILHNKDFMNSLLNTSLFDDYLVEEASIKTFNTFSIDGTLHKDFYEADESAPESAFSDWSMIRPIAFFLIKGKRTPLSFRFILKCKKELVSAILKDEMSPNPDDISSFMLKIGFLDGIINITTGVSVKTFIADKSYEKKWDQFVMKMLTDNNIDFEEIV